MPDFDEENPQEEYPQAPSQPEASGDDDQQQGGGRSKLDNLQDANDLRKKLSGEGGKEGSAGATDAAGTGEVAGEAGAAEGAGGAATGSGAAAGAGEAAGGAGATGATAATGSGGVAAGGVTAGTGGATAATGAAGAGATVSGTAGVAAGGAAATTGTAAAGAGATALSGPAAPITATGALVVGAATTDKGRKGLIFGCLGCLGCGGMLLALPLLVLFTLGGGGSSTEASGLGGNSKNLTLSKTASVTKIPKGAAGTQVTYTITVTNHTTKDATQISITDTFSSLPEASFAAEITGYDPTLAIDTLAPGASATKTYTVTIPHTDFDPGWILFNTAKSSGTIAGGTERSTAGATLIIGNPPTGPPAFSPLHDPFITGYTFGVSAQGSNGTYIHQGIDLGASDRTILSPFAQPAVVITNDPAGDGNNDGFGNYIVLGSGEWEVLMAHMVSPSTLSKGQTVDSNTVIGIMGHSGFIIPSGGGDGTHLHYEVHQNGTPVDPELYNALTPHP